MGRRSASPNVAAAREHLPQKLAGFGAVGRRQQGAGIGGSKADVGDEREEPLRLADDDHELPGPQALYGDVFCEAQREPVPERSAHDYAQLPRALRRPAHRPQRYHIPPDNEKPGRLRRPRLKSSVLLDAPQSVFAISVVLVLVTSSLGIADYLCVIFYFDFSTRYSVFPSLTVFDFAFLFFCFVRHRS